MIGTVLLTKKSIRFFKVAAAIAATSPHPKVQIGACITVKNVVVSVGSNLNKSHPVQKKYNKNRGFCVDIHNSLHAEMAALLRTDEDLTGASIYVFRKDRLGRPANCRPCPACGSALLKRGVRHIHYTNAEGYVYEEWK